MHVVEKRLIFNYREVRERLRIIFVTLTRSISQPGTYAISIACNETIGYNTTGCEDDEKPTTFDTFLDLGRNIIPDNIVASTFEISSTETMTNDDGNITKVRTNPKSVNLLGLITCAVAFGLSLAKLSDQG